MRKLMEPTQEMQDAYDDAYRAYEARLAEYNALSAWKKLTTRKPRWNAIAPGGYAVNVWHYFDRSENDMPAGDIGTWAAVRYDEHRMEDYSPAWYAQLEVQQEQEARRQRQLQQDNVDAMWRANVGAAYYDLNQPWAWQRKPSGPFG